MRWILLSVLFAVSGCSSIGEGLDRSFSSSSSSSATQREPSSELVAGAPPQVPPSRVPPSPVDETPSIDLSGLTREQLFSHYNRLRGDPYPLDELTRHLESADDPLPCNGPDLTVYKGSELSMLPTRMHPAFAERLARLERAAIEVGEEVYGRAPARIRHMGAYVCRKSRFRARRISEHALGNAIDVLGFDFAPAKSAQDAEHLPPGLRWSFQVSVARHWTPRPDAASALHAEFLKKLTDRVLEDSIFRVALGPSHRGHHDHFHFDMSPWTYSHL